MLGVVDGFNAAKAEKVVESSVEWPEATVSDQELDRMESQWESFPEDLGYKCILELKAYRELKKRSDGGVE